VGLRVQRYRLASEEGPQSHGVKLMPSALQDCPPWHAPGPTQVWVAPGTQTRFGGSTDVGSDDAAVAPSGSLGGTVVALATAAADEVGCASAARVQEASLVYEQWYFSPLQ
jgi:hypothetical protein